MVYWSQSVLKVVIKKPINFKLRKQIYILYNFGIKLPVSRKPMFFGGRTIFHKKVLGKSIWSWRDRTLISVLEFRDRNRTKLCVILMTICHDYNRLRIKMIIIRNIWKRCRLRLGVSRETKKGLRSR